jgi:hypothetical protein
VREIQSRIAEMCAEVGARMFMTSCTRELMLSSWTGKVLTVKALASAESNLGPAFYECNLESNQDRSLMFRPLTQHVGLDVLRA